MNSNTNLYAVIFSGELLRCTDGSIICPATAEMKSLFREDSDAIKYAEGLGKFEASLHNEFQNPATGLKWEYVGTVDGRYGAEGNRIEQEEWKRLEEGGCHWDIAYTITFRNKSRTLEINVCKWVDFEY